MKRFNKLVATLLCTLMVFTSFNLNVFAENTSDELAVYSGSSTVSEIVSYKKICFIKNLS